MGRFTRFAILVVALVFVLFAARPALADVTGRIAGSVVGKTGAAVLGASVEVANSALNA